jgi:hypothetical protein
MDSDAFNCTMCFFECASATTFTNHIVWLHQHDPHFSVTCCIGACGYSAKRWGNYKVHVHRRHKVIEDNFLQSAAAASGSDDHAITTHAGASDNNEANSNVMDIHYYNAVYTLALEAKHNISQSGIDGIIQSTSMLIEHHVTDTQIRLKIIFGVTVLTPH